MKEIECFYPIDRLDDGFGKEGFYPTDKGARGKPKPGFYPSLTRPFSWPDYPGCDPGDVPGPYRPYKRQTMKKWGD